MNIYLNKLLRLTATANEKNLFDSVYTLINYKLQLC